MKEIRFAVRALIVLVAVILASFALNPAFMYGYEWVGRVSTLVVCGEILVAIWVAAEGFFLIIAALTAFGRWLFPPYGQVH